MRKFILDIQALALRNEIEIRRPSNSESNCANRSGFYHNPFQNMYVVTNKKGMLISFILSGWFSPKIIDWNSQKCIDLTWKEYYAIIKYANTKILDNNDIANGYAKMLEESERKILEKGK